jgi:hypothetical protein
MEIKSIVAPGIPLVIAQYSTTMESVLPLKQFREK